MARQGKMRGVAAVAAAAVGVAGMAPASADSAPDAESLSAASSSWRALAAVAGAKETQKVTLITGDQVWVTRSTDESGKKSVKTRIVPAKRADGRSVSFAQWGTPEEFFVVPSDVLPLIGSRVDRAIFDVARLIDSGASTSPETRVIVSFKGSASGLAAASSAVSAKANATGATVLPSANAVALKVPAGKGAGLFDQLETAASGQAYVSLDARFKALDTTSMPQIGATKAWKSGYTGKGIKVAVLDTGVDDTHPDLKGQVSAAKDFSGSGSPMDRYGHGTHVASIVAGTGKAGGPGMRGVAYEATLLNGKVLSDDGYGSESDIIKGMEWAAKSGADVVNMSLGGWPGNGTDPVEKSIDALSKQYGTVFAVAAGNSGEEGDGLVSSPSTAASAISVAAVDSKNRRAPFSDTGPGRGNWALKPDVSAPGVGIRAARSKVNVWDSGTSPYVKLSGTSMATPHVAGAAALLAQARPDLSGSELKSVLMGGATDRKANVWQEGTGTINVPGSIGMPVIAQEGSLSFGIVPFPQSKARDRVKTIHYRNTGTKPVTLTLKSDVTDAKGAKAKGVKLSKTRLTVPAKGAAAVRVTLTPGGSGAGTYGGAITATPSKGHAIRTTLGWTNEIQRFSVKLKAVDRAGKPVVADAVVYGVGKDDDFFDIQTFKGETVLKMPAGTYFAGGYLGEPGTSKFGTMLGVEPQFTVKGDTTITLDGRKARTLEVKTPRPSTPGFSTMAYGRKALSGEYVDFVLIGDPGEKLWVTPTKATTVGSSWFVENATMVAPGTAPAYNYQLAYLTRNRIPASLKHTVTSRQVATSIGSFRSRIKGLAEADWFAEFDEATAAASFSQKVRMPSTFTTYLVGAGANWSVDVSGPRAKSLEGESWFEAKGRKIVPGSTTKVDYFTGVMSPGAVSGGGAFRYRDHLGAFLPVFEDSAGRVGYGQPSTRVALAAYVDGKKVADVKDVGFDIPAPKGKSLRLVQQVDRKANWWGWTTSSTGEWIAQIPSEGDQVLPLMNIQYKLSGMPLSGVMPAGEQTVGLRVTRHSNPNSDRGNLISAKVMAEYSVDGGKTWKQAKVKSSGKKATATFTPPAPKKGATTKVSLRVSAVDGKGSSVKETMISAYELSGK